MLKPNELQEHLAFLNKYKEYFGFSGFKIDLVDKTNKNPIEEVAEVDIDFYEHVIKITLYKAFTKRTDKEAVLIHELIHGRISFFHMNVEKKIESIETEEEELLANDLTRGFMSVITTK